MLRTFRPKDNVPGLGWMRLFYDRVRASSVKARPPLYTSVSDAGTRLHFKPTLKFNGTITANLGGGAYTVVESYFEPISRNWFAVSGGRSATAYDYNRAASIGVGTIVEARYTEADDWRFWLAGDTSGIPCAPCEIPSVTTLNLYYRYVQYNQGTIPYTLCADRELTTTLTYNSALSAWESGCVVFPGLNYIFGTCSTAGDFTKRFKFFCQGGKVTLTEQFYFSATDCTNLISTFNYTVWNPFSCSPFSVRNTFYDQSVGGPYLFRDIWVYE